MSGSAATAREGGIVVLAKSDGIEHMLTAK